MKKMLTVKNDAYLAARTSVVLVIAFALGFGFWTAMTPVAKAQQMSATEMIQSKLPQGKTLATATKPELLSAVCASVKQWPDAAPRIVKTAIDSHRRWARDIVSTAIRCLGAVNCDTIGAIVSAAVVADPDDAAGISEMVIREHPDCRGSIGRDFKGGEDKGGPPPEGFGNPPPDVNPPPGSIGGGGGGFNPQEILVCRNGVQLFIFPRDLRPGDIIGTCVVTTDTNQ